MTEQEAIELCRNDPKTAAKIILRVEHLEAQIKVLEDKLSLNSQNSSKPPSTDNKLNKPKKNKSTQSSKKRRGGQKGHKGTTLKMVTDPDKVVSLRSSHCRSCHCLLGDTDSVKIEKRQLFDIEIRRVITEYRAHTHKCPACGCLNKASFPEEIKAPAQYGDNLKAFVAYLNTYQMLPYERIAEMIEDLTRHPIGTGTLYSFLEKQYRALEPFEARLKESLLQEEVLHGDETGINTQAKLHWVHILSSSSSSFFLPHPKRGKEAMEAMGILPEYEGILLHDHWAPYRHFDRIHHSFCNAHILRELKGVVTFEGAQWAKDMHRVLTEMSHTVNQARKSPKGALSSGQIEKFTQAYEKILQAAYRYYPPPDRKKKGGRVKQPKGKNLLDRLSKYQEGHLLFLNNPNVPFTNNQAERDLRMIKVKEKISGCFASVKGSEIFCRLRSYISTLKKNDVPVLQAMKDALRGQCYMPAGVGC